MTQYRTILSQVCQNIQKIKTPNVPLIHLGELAHWTI